MNYMCMNVWSIHVYECMKYTCINVWSKHVWMHEVYMYECMKCTCMNAWSIHVRVWMHEVYMYECMKYTCMNAWSIRVWMHEVYMYFGPLTSLNSNYCPFQSKRYSCVSHYIDDSVKEKILSSRVRNDSSLMHRGLDDIRITSHEILQTWAIF